MCWSWRTFCCLHVLSCWHRRLLLCSILPRNGRTRYDIVSFDLSNAEGEKHRLFAHFVSLLLEIYLLADWSLNVVYWRFANFCLSVFPSTFTFWKDSFEQIFANMPPFDKFCTSNKFWLQCQSFKSLLKTNKETLHEKSIKMLHFEVIGFFFFTRPRWTPLRVLYTCSVS